MNKTIAIELQDFCQTIADRYSNVNRVGNVNNETFTVQEIGFQAFLYYKLEAERKNYSKNF